MDTPNPEYHAVQSGKEFLMPVNHKAKSRVAVLAAGLLVTLPLLGSAPAHAKENTPAVTRAGECVLSADSPSGLECGPGLAKGPLAVQLWQHPFYEGERLPIYLPRGQSRCTATRSDNDEYRNLPHGGWWDNRISSVKTHNRCDVKLFDGHKLRGHKRGATGWIEYCDRLSLKSGTCKYWTGPRKRFDNVTSSFRVS